MVMATQNPIEYEGTFPLPEAQLDRFMMRLEIGYPDLDQEMRILDMQQYRHPIETLEAIVEVEDVLEAQEAIKDVYVAPAVKEYIVRLSEQTRRHPDIYLGASPRGSLYLYRTGQARAASLGRDYVLPDDIKRLAKPVLSHRLILSPNARLRDVTREDILDEILENLVIPEGEVTRAESTA
jgi:MoxR-like ATPase